MASDVHFSLEFSQLTSVCAYLYPSSMSYHHTIFFSRQISGSICSFTDIVDATSVISYLISNINKDLHFEYYIFTLDTRHYINVVYTMKVTIKLHIYIIYIIYIIYLYYIGILMMSNIQHSSRNPVLYTGPLRCRWNPFR